GYFPETIEYINIKTLKNYGKTKILWVGRLLGWKHPELAVALAERLMNDGYEFELNIIGDGDQKERLEGEIKKKKLSSVVNMLGSKNSAEVRTYMEKAHVFISTSGFYEGW